jgi:hypothetical protein
MKNALNVVAKFPFFGVRNTKTTIGIAMHATKIFPSTSNAPNATKNSV